MCVHVSTTRSALVCHAHSRIFGPTVASIQLVYNKCTLDKTLHVHMNEGRYGWKHQRGRQLLQSRKQDRSFPKPHSVSLATSPNSF